MSNFCIRSEVRVKVLSFTYFAYSHPIVLALFNEKIVPSPLNCLGNTTANQLIIHVWVYFSTLYSIPLIYMSVFMSIPNRYCLDYCNLIIHIKIKQCRSSTSFFFRMIFALLGSFVFPYELYNLAVNFCKKSCWGFNWDCIESVDQCGQCWHLNNIKCSDP